MDSLVQLEYIIERERSGGVPTDLVDEVRPVAVSRRFIDYLRRMSFSYEPSVTAGSASRCKKVNRRSAGSA